MIEMKLESCWNMLDAVGTCLNRPSLSHNVGTGVLGKKQEWSEFGGISGFVGTVGTVGTEKGVVENFRHKNQDARFKTGEVNRG